MTFDIILSPNLKLSGRLGNPCTSQIVFLFVHHGGFELLVPLFSVLLIRKK